eukprot:g19664.t1
MVMEKGVLSQKDWSVLQDSGRGQESIAAEIESISESLFSKKASYEETGKQLENMREELQNLGPRRGTVIFRQLETVRVGAEELEQKRVTHKIQQLQKDDKESHVVVARMEKEHPWIQKEQALFGKKGTDFDFQGSRYQDNKQRLEKLNTEQKKLSKNINKKAMVMFERAEQEYKETRAERHAASSVPCDSLVQAQCAFLVIRVLFILRSTSCLAFLALSASRKSSRALQELLSKRDIILNDKGKIEKVIKDLDEKKTETLRRTWKKVNKDFDSIFGTLLPNTNAKLEPPQGMDETEGLEIKVAFHGVWKQSLTELSGGQRSLLALSLVLALLLFKPAPMYILDEIDSALDLSHTQNIGHMIRTHFPHSQFIVVSLKEGMFNHANVLFRTRFIDGTSTVTRYAIRDDDDRVAMPPQKKARKEAAK